MKFKATFLLVPCIVDVTTLEVFPRYGWINDKILDIAFRVWDIFVAPFIDPDGEGYPFTIYSEIFERDYKQHISKKKEDK